MEENTFPDDRGQANGPAKDQGCDPAGARPGPAGPLPYPLAWELQGQGFVTTGREGEKAPGQPASAPWFDVRLTFADGARVDVLAVLDGGRPAIEDLRADPPLPLAALGLLAGRIGNPLAEVCRGAGGASGEHPAPDPRAPDAPAPHTADPAPAVRDASADAGPVPLAAVAGQSPSAGQSAPERSEPAVAGPVPGALPAGPPAGVRDGDGRDVDVREVDGSAGGGETVSRTPPGHTAGPDAPDAPDAVGHRRTRGTPPRGRTGRRIAADAYRAAQREGADPVLAVMSVTGRSRRRALRLIAGARDDGYLAPRHHRRRRLIAPPGGG